MSKQIEKIERIAVANALNEVCKTDLSNRPDEVIGLIKSAIKILRDGTNAR